MNNLNRLNIELNEKQYFKDWQETYSMFLEENGLDPAAEYDKPNDHTAMLESVYSVLQTLANNIDAFRKVETEFATTTAAYQYLQNRLKDVRAEIDRVKDVSGTSDSCVSYMFFNGTI